MTDKYNKYLEKIANFDFEAHRHLTEMAAKKAPTTNSVSTSPGNWTGKNFATTAARRAGQIAPKPTAMGFMKKLVTKVL